MPVTDENRAANEPAFRTRIIDRTNKQSAETKNGIMLRLPQNHPAGHVYSANVNWTKEEADRYLADGTLPRTLSTVGAGLYFWIFDATGSTPAGLPEMEFDPMPDLERHPCVCIFHFDGLDYTAIVPSEVLRLVQTGPNRGRLIVDERRMAAMTMPNASG